MLELKLFAPESTVVGFIGVGTMGKPMVKNLIKAGYQLKLYDLFPTKALEVVADGGAELMDSPKVVAEVSDVVITMVNDAPNLREVLFGDSGATKAAHAGQVFIDSSTISPTEVRRCSKAIAENGGYMLDAPVSGGEKGATEGTLTIMVGGEESVFNACQPIFNALGNTLTYMGKSGSGQVTKLGNQIMFGLNTLGVCEGLMLATREGVDLEKYLKAVTTGSGGSVILSGFGPYLAKRIFPGSFPVRLMRKDFRLITETMAEENISLPGSALLLQLYNSAAAVNDMASFESLIVALEKLNGFQVNDYQEK